MFLLAEAPVPVRDPLATRGMPGYARVATRGLRPDRHTGLPTPLRVDQGAGSSCAQDRGSEHPRALGPIFTVPYEEKTQAVLLGKPGIHFRATSVFILP